MANDTVTLALDGDVSLDVFASAAKDLAALINALSSEIAGQDRPQWTVQYLDGGSATMTFGARGSEEETIKKVIRGFATVGRSLESGEAIPYSQKVESAARGLTAALNGAVTAVRFETSEVAAAVKSSAYVEAERSLQAYGAVEGRVQTLTSRGGLNFVLYDSVYGRAVRCFLEPGREETMRGAWDRRAVVEGWVSRDPISGRPVSVRKVSTLSLLDEVEHGSFRKARGAVPRREGDSLPEETVRIMRDAS
ncbi:MAG: hypothetical protein OXG37_00610 [Actinomycetia bacterium]|nr:hypothetical protein [Actinomycetes bacterium]